MNKKILWAVLAVIIIAVVAGGYLYWKKSKIKPTTTQTSLPDFGVQTAPLENMPETNPTAKTNPYKSVKTNPFE